MPYIAPRDRDRLDPFINQVPVRGLTAGELNYIFTRLLLRWLREGFAGYAERALAVGILETAKLELYRRDLGPYEDAKCYANGDVYTEGAEGPKPAEDSAHRLTPGGQSAGDAPVGARPV